METNPYQSEDYTSAGERLRQVIALLSRYQIPPTPVNYQLVYDYICGRNKRLKELLTDADQHSTKLEQAKLWALYQDYYAQSDVGFEKLRQELKVIVDEIQTELNKSGDSFSGYSSTLSRFSEILDSSPEPEVMAIEVKKVVDDTDSMKQIQDMLETSISNTMDEVEALRKEIEQVKEESQTDALTGIANRKAFNMALEDALAAAHEGGSPFCLVLADIDNFKLFNDKHGHLVGDKVLRFVASTLKQSLGKEDMVARFGGEEFVVILAQDSLDTAAAIADKIRLAVCAAPLKGTKNGQDYGNISISLGVSLFVAGEKADDLIERTDQALYKAKDLGRNQVVMAEV